MKYWLFDGNDIIGPFAPHEIAAREGFSAQTLVCPESESEQAGAWKTAAEFDDFSEEELKKSTQQNFSETPAADQPTGNAILPSSDEPTPADSPQTAPLQVPAPAAAADAEPAPETPFVPLSTVPLSAQPQADEPLLVAPVEPSPEQEVPPVAELKSISLSDIDENECLHLKDTEIIVPDLNKEEPELVLNKPENEDEKKEEQPAAQPADWPVMSPLSQAQPAEQQTDEVLKISSAENTPHIPVLPTEEIQPEREQAEIKQETIEQPETEQQEPETEQADTTQLPDLAATLTNGLTNGSVPENAAQTDLAEMTENNPEPEETVPTTQLQVPENDVPQETNSTAREAAHEGKYPLAPRFMGGMGLALLLVLLLVGLVCFILPAQTEGEDTLEPFAAQKSAAPKATVAQPTEEQSVATNASLSTARPGSSASDQQLTQPVAAPTGTNKADSAPLKEIAVPPPATLSQTERAIKLVKNYQLSDGRGSIETYLNRLYRTQLAQGYSADWSADPLHKNSYIVKYRLTKTRTEPLVYVFQVDVEKNKLTGALNNITLDLVGKL